MTPHPHLANRRHDLRRLRGSAGKSIKRLPDVDAEVNFASPARGSPHARPSRPTAAMAAVARAGFQVPLSRQRLTLEGMTCAACAQRIESAQSSARRARQRQPATASAEVDYPPAWSAAHSCGRGARAGYQAQLPRADTPSHLPASKTTGRWLLASVLALPFVAEMLAMLAGRHGLLPVAWQWALATPVQFLVAGAFIAAPRLSPAAAAPIWMCWWRWAPAWPYLLSVWTALTAPHHGHVL